MYNHFNHPSQTFSWNQNSFQSRFMDTNEVWNRNNNNNIPVSSSDNLSTASDIDMNKNTPNSNQTDALTHQS